MSELKEQPKIEEAPEISKADKEKLQALGKEFMTEKKAEMEEIAATKEWLFGRSERKYPIVVEVDGVNRIFQARRLNEAERIKMESVKRRIGMTPPAEMTDEEFNLAQKQGYELLEVAIVEPALTQDEWEKVDLALIAELLDKINILQIEVNDAKALDELRNL